MLKLMGQTRFPGGARAGPDTDATSELAFRESAAPRRTSCAAWMAASKRSRKALACDWDEI